MDAPRHYAGFEGQYIGGSWRSGRAGRSALDVDPYTGETLLELALGDRRDVDDAYRAAASAQAAWSATPPAERAEVTRRFAGLMEARQAEIEDWLVRESGSTRLKARYEWQLARGITLEAASFAHHVAGPVLPVDEPGKESRVYRRPVGVVGVISPWNFPMYLGHRTIGPAIALGNAVVVKPSLETPVTGGLLAARMYEQAGLPPGVLNVVTGASADIGDPFVQHPIPRAIAFTGSTEVGRRVASLAAIGPMLKRVTLELGGNSPLVVLDDADLDQAVRAAVFGRFLHQGQICMSANRLIVDASLYDDFVERFTARVRGLRYGDPKDPDTVIGPIINARQLARMLEHVEGARGAGARQLLGGDPEGLVLPPHVFSHVTNDMPIARHETFGPIAPIIEVKGESEAIRVANDTEYGLSSAVFTRDEARGLRFAHATAAGMTHVNDSTVGDSPNCPFGGEKNSGIGRHGGEWVMRELTTDHWVTVQRSPRAYPF